MTARPVTQQGMSGMRAVAAGTARQVQDAHYFYAKLSEKRSQLLEANDKLRNDMEAAEAARPKVGQLAHRLEELTGEVKAAELQCHNYNLVLQKATQHVKPADVQSEIAATQVRSSRPRLMS